jgi:hypothetical protein
MNPTLSTVASPAFDKRNDRPTVIDGLRRQDAHSRRERIFAFGATGLADRGQDLYAHCVTCGALASDWRRLLGIGAQVVASTAGGKRVTLRHPGACQACCASDLVVTAYLAAEAA